MIRFTQSVEQFSAKGLIFVKNKIQLLKNYERDLSIDEGRKSVAKSHIHKFDMKLTRNSVHCHQLILKLHKMLK